jgi:hypothetical protein
VKKDRWLIFAYTLPPEPSRLRVSVWRRLRKLGAIYLPEGFWVLPFTENLVEEVKRTIREIQDSRGRVFAFESVDFSPEQTGLIRSRILAARNEEYAELQGQCSKFILHVEHATLTERYTFSEIEELEEEIGKIERWLQEIRARDLLGSPDYEVSAEAIQNCRVLLQQFIERAFERNDNSPTGISTPID